VTQSVDQAIAGFNPALPLAVALSGGADSVALLVACAEKWPGQVVVLHINHGLQAAATLFEDHCRALCQRLNVPLQVQTVDASKQAGQSPEDAARQARYMAFSALALVKYGNVTVKSIAIAQHADDQVETLLLALSRGAGLAGLSAMPAHWQRDGLDYYRPFLAVAGADIRTWLEQRGVPFVEDPTNQDEQFTRNRIRARLMPALRTAFPQFLDTFARSASHAAQAQQLLDEVAAQDVQAVGRSTDGLPRIKALQAMSRARQANALRYWLKHSLQVIPSAAQLAELLDQVADCTTRGHRIHMKVGHGFVQRSSDVLTWYNP
jgi:tRNA(Ile)-lysidine synthase